MVGKTGQLWKLTGSLLLAVIATGLLGMMVKGLNSPSTSNQDASVFYGVAFVGVAVVLFAWLAIAIKCQRCGYGVVFKLMRQHSINDWHQKLTTATVCPICGDAVQPTTHRAVAKPRL